MNRTERISRALRTLSWVEHAAAEAWIKGTGLTRQQARTLGYIDAQQDRGVIAREIAEVSATTPASVASLLQGLEDRDLITRTPSATDSRVKLLRTTPEGSRLIAGFDVAVAEARERLFSPLTAPDQELLLRLVQTVIDGTDPALLPPERRPDGRAAP